MHSDVSSGFLINLSKFYSLDITSYLIILSRSSWVSSCHLIHILGILTAPANAN
jgi:hypothetical protein